MDALERLRALILPDEQAALRRQQQALDALTARHERLPRELPDLLVRAGEGAGAKRLREALAAPVADALGEAVRQRRQMLVDALFPVMGPAIRRAIAEYLRQFTEGLNRAVEYSLTPRGLAWRIEAWRSGVPFAHVVLKHTLRFRIDHLFLIDAASGIVLHRADAPELRELDADAVAGMLTAIGDFVRDAVAGGNQSLDAATVGEHTVLVERGPRANLACFVRGVPTGGLRTAMAQALERIHQQLEAPSGNAAEARLSWEELLDLGTLDRSARAADPPLTAAVARPARWPARLVLVLILAAALSAAWWGYRQHLWRSQARAAVAELAQTPGLVVVSAQTPARGRLRVQLLADALAPDPAAWLRTRLPGLEGLELERRGYIATDAPIVLARAQAALADWPDVRVEAIADGKLRLVGTVADALSAEHLRERVAALPGVLAVDAQALTVRVDPLEQLDRAIVDANAALAGLHVRFADGDRPLDADETARTLQAMRSALAPALTAATDAGQRLRLNVYGHNDDSGTPLVNQRMRTLRARWLATQLGDPAQELPVQALDIALADDDAGLPAQGERAASLRVARSP